MAIKKNLLIVICFLGLMLTWGCEEEKPEYVLSEETMTQLLLEIYLGEGKVSSLSVKRDSALVIFEEYEKLIFEKYEIDRERYKKSLSYYFDHPTELEQIYNNVLDSLNLKEQKLKESKKTEEDKTEGKKPLKEEE